MGLIHPIIFGLLSLFVIDTAVRILAHSDAASLRCLIFVLLALQIGALCVCSCASLARKHLTLRHSKTHCKHKSVGVCSVSPFVFFAAGVFVLEAGGLFVLETGEVFVLETFGVVLPAFVLASFGGVLQTLQVC